MSARQGLKPQAGTENPLKRVCRCFLQKGNMKKFVHIIFVSLSILTPLISACQNTRVSVVNPLTVTPPATSQSDLAQAVETKTTQLPSPITSLSTTTKWLTATCNLDGFLPLVTFSASTQPGIEMAQPLDWAPHEEMITYPKGDSIWNLAAPDYQPQLFFQLPGAIFSQLVWSPDGSQLAFSGGQPDTGRSTIGLVDRRKKQVVDLLLSEKNLDHFAGKSINQWLDNQSLAFTVHVGTGVELLYQVDVINPKPAAILGSLDEKKKPEQRPYGGPYYFSPQNQNLLLVGHFYNGHLALLDLTNNDVTWLSPIETPPSDSFQGWTQEGNAFLLSQWSEAAQRSALWLWSVEQKQGKKLLDDVVYARFDASNQQVAFLQTADPRLQQLQLGILDLATGAVTYYRTGLSSENYRNVDVLSSTYLAWSPDSAYLAYRDVPNRVWIISRTQQCQQLLYAATAEIKALKWSPHSNKLLVILPDQALLLDLTTISQ